RVGDAEARAELRLVALAALDVGVLDLRAGREEVVAQAGVQHQALELPAVLEVGRALGIEVRVVRADAARQPVALAVRRRQRHVLYRVVARVDAGLPRVLL